ncbi:MAG: DUF4166 domain-containing protein [Betaproteobacteria bacterium]
MKSLYQIVLGDAWDRLPAAVRELHGHTESARYRGRGSVERGQGLLSRIVGVLMRFPPAMEDTPVSVDFDIHDGEETWTRTFGRHSFQSTLSAKGKYLRESFGAVKILFMLETDANALRMLPVRWTALGVPVPKMLWPRIVAHEIESGGRFNFHVEASMPVAGLVVRYRGYLVKNTEIKG